ncbi:unnamed protein product, partial [Closterium sp. NIES-53]
MVCEYQKPSGLKSGRKNTGICNNPTRRDNIDSSRNNIDSRRDNISNTNNTYNTTHELFDGTNTHQRHSTDS